MTSTPRIDSHHHLWRPDRGDYGWLDAPDPALAPLRRDVMPDEFRRLTRRHGIVRSIVVQAAPTVAETRFLLQLARATPWIEGVVGWVDLADPASVEVLQELARDPHFKGVRPMLQDLPDADWIARAPHPAVVRTLIRLGLRFDALVTPRELPALCRFVAAWPDLPVVLDHAGKPPLAAVGPAAAAAWQRWHTAMSELGRRPQLMCKFSGLLTEAAGIERQGEAASLGRLRPLWRQLLADFGADRLMWGSDWPVLTLACGYDRWLACADALIDELTPTGRHALRCGNAARFYGLDLPAGAATGPQTRPAPLA
jgi:L-fuconolactonase